MITETVVQDVLSIPLQVPLATAKVTRRESLLTCSAGLASSSKQSRSTGDICSSSVIKAWEAWDCFLRHTSLLYSTSMSLMHQFLTFLRWLWRHGELVTEQYDTGCVEGCRLRNCAFSVRLRSAKSTWHAIMVLVVLGTPSIHSLQELFSQRLTECVSQRTSQRVRQGRSQ